MLVLRDHCSSMEMRTQTMAVENTQLQGQVQHLAVYRRLSLTHRDDIVDMNLFHRPFLLESVGNQSIRGLHFMLSLTHHVFTCYPHCLPHLVAMLHGYACVICA